MRYEVPIEKSERSTAGLSQQTDPCHCGHRQISINLLL